MWDNDIDYIVSQQKVINDAAERGVAFKSSMEF